MRVKKLFVAFLKGVKAGRIVAVGLRVVVQNLTHDIGDGDDDDVGLFNFFSLSLFSACILRVNKLLFYTFQRYIHYYTPCVSAPLITNPLIVGNIRVIFLITLSCTHITVHRSYRIVRRTCSRRGDGDGSQQFSEHCKNTRI